MHNLKLSLFVLSPCHHNQRQRLVWTLLISRISSWEGGNVPRCFFPTTLSSHYTSLAFRCVGLNWKTLFIFVQVWLIILEGGHSRVCRVKKFFFQLSKPSLNRIQTTWSCANVSHELMLVHFSQTVLAQCQTTGSLSHITFLGKRNISINTTKY